MTFTAFRSAWRRVTERGAALFFVAMLLWAPRGVAAEGQAPAAQLPPPHTQTSETYRIQATDILVIEVVNEPKLAAKEFRVTAGGEVSYPFVGAIKVGDRTPADVQAELKRLLEADYLVSAQVLVQVKEYRKRVVSVLGQVTRPGQYEIPAERKWSIMDAIAAAGGTTRLARTSDIQLTRPGRKEPLRFREEELRNPDKPVFVEQDDVIFVPESRI